MSANWAGVSPVPDLASSPTVSRIIEKVAERRFSYNVAWLGVEVARKLVA